MNYEQKYKEALDRAKKELQTCGSTDCDATRQIFRLFPELAESEDERIRKALIKYLDALDDDEVRYGVSFKDMRVWLEKQGEQNSTPKFKIGDTIHKIGENTVFPRIIEKIEDGDYVCNNSHSFVNIKFQDDYELVEQKSVDKAEPKFKIGDWITFYGGKPFKILKVESEQNGILDYLLLGQNGRDSYYNSKYVDENARLWTIQDATDGDVLAAHECLVLFKEIDGLNIRCYCTYHYLNSESFYIDTLQNKTAFQPATKEQCDLLFQKMKEEGYVWYAEKKELKKIEKENPYSGNQKQEWSEEDKSMYIRTLGILGKCYMGELPTKVEEELKWFKSIKPQSH